MTRPDFFFGLSPQNLPKMVGRICAKIYLVSNEELRHLAWHPSSALLMPCKFLRNILVIFLWLNPNLSSLVRSKWPTPQVLPLPRLARRIAPGKTPQTFKQVRGDINVSKNNVSFDRSKQMQSHFHDNGEAQKLSATERRNVQIAPSEVADIIPFSRRDRV